VDKKSLETLLEGTGIPYAYHHFVSPPPPPYIVYLSPGPDNFGADNKVHYSGQNWQVELYTRKKDPATEQLVEAALAEVYWEKSESYIESEGLYQVLYEI
jgi:hypothetical protein